MLKKPLSYVIVAALGAAACSKAPKPGPSSQVSSFTLDELPTGPKDPVWESVSLRMNRLAPKVNSLSKEFARKNYQSGRIEDVSIQVEYGTYTIALAYHDANKTLVYQTCDDAKDLTYEIKTPKFHTEVSICRVAANGGQTPAGTVGIKPSADVTINPTFDGPSESGAAISGNPFSGSSLYVNPKYSESVLASAARESPELAAKMKKLSGISTAFWLDKTAKVKDLSGLLAAAQAAQTSGKKSMLVTIVVYNLPERDCAASSSAGELSGASGLESYKKQYIDEIAKVLKQYSALKIAAIVEPDSLPNMATNLSQAKCVGAARLYKEGVAYAIKTLALPNVALYLDAAHGGWLGWPDNRKKMALIFKEVLDLAGGSHLIRGFASNVSNYSPLTRSQTEDNSEAYYQSNPARDELTFTRLLAEDLSAVGIKNVHFVIDTSRNGKTKSRDVWGSWCNIKAAGIGERPQLAPASGIDAYIWVKPPGESDGVSDAGAPRFDPSCTSADSMMPAPQAGEWFHEHFKTLVTNAVPAL